MTWITSKLLAVFNMSKIQIWKRITTNFNRECFRWWAVFNMSKIQIWKRITTYSGCRRVHKKLYLICQRYKFESESQHHRGCFFQYLAVFNMSKIQIWKRITTRSLKNISAILLYLICQRYKFESESQRVIVYLSVSSAVFNMSKIQIWKRITTPG